MRTPLAALAASCRGNWCSDGGVLAGPACCLVRREPLASRAVAGARASIQTAREPVPQAASMAVCCSVTHSFKKHGEHTAGAWAGTHLHESLSASPVHT